MIRYLHRAMRRSLLVECRTPDYEDVGWDTVATSTVGNL